MLLQAQIGDVAAVARNDLRLRQSGREVELIGITEEKFARLDERARSRRRVVAAAFDRRLRQTVAIAEMLVRVIEGRNGCEIEARQHGHAAFFDEARVLECAAFALRYVVREQNGDSVKIGAGEVPHPVLRTVLACRTQHLGARSHALAEFLRKGRKGFIVHAQRAQAVPGEADRDPARIRDARADGIRASDLFEHGRKPGMANAGIRKGQKFVTRRHRGRARNEKVLDVFELEHRAAPLRLRHCIWSSIAENAALSVSAFLISSAVT